MRRSCFVFHRRANHLEIARGDQGVNYAAGTWQPSSFAMNELSAFLVVDRKCEGGDGDEFMLAVPMLRSLEKFQLWNLSWMRRPNFHDAAQTCSRLK